MQLFIAWYNIMPSSDEEESENVEITKARKILSWRPCSRAQQLPSKGGPKFFGRTGAGFEIQKVNDQLKQYDNVLCSLKVRKSSKLGRAEWVGEYGLAKIIKQAKFIQTMGHHEKGFFALYPEEALFLLDIGDLELTLNDIPLSLQGAFSVALGENSTLDDFTTFSNLVKRGYIVRRHGIPLAKAKTKKHRRPSDDKTPSTSKHPKLDDTIDIVRAAVSDEQMDCTTSNKQRNCRNWFIGNPEYEISPTTNPSDTQQKANNQPEVQFPNMVDRSNNVLPAPPPDLLPAGIPSPNHCIHDVWFQRIKRDNTSNRKARHSHRSVAREAKNWSEYKALRFEEQNKLQDVVNSWEVKPMLLPGTFSVSEGLRKIRGSVYASTSSRTPVCTFNLRFNVYEAGSAPFKKSNPGPASFVVVVTNVHAKPPTSYDILYLLKIAKGVPIKFAVVDDGEVSFYEFENANLPVIN